MGKGGGSYMTSTLRWTWDEDPIKIAENKDILVSNTNLVYSLGGGNKIKSKNIADVLSGLPRHVGREGMT